jgi:tetratricopeptide (TPR) repeat protein
MSGLNTLVLDTVEAWLAIGERDRAFGLCESRLRGNPADPPALMALARLLSAEGRVDEAAGIAGQALRLAPRWQDGWVRLAGLLDEAGQGEAAVSAWTAALALAPLPPGLLQDATRQAQAAGRMEAAERFAAATVAAAPDHWIARFNHAVILLELGRLRDSVATLEIALARRGDGDSDDAARRDTDDAARRCAIADLLNNQANLLKDAGQHDDAVAAYRRALALCPDAASIHSNLLLCLSYHGGLDRAAVLDEHREYGRRFSRPFDPLDFPNDPDPDRCLRVGYVSPDFRHHVVAEMSAGLFESHDPGDVEVFCYAEVTRPDAVTAGLQARVSHWRFTPGLSDEALARQIREDRIDVLVDLAGHTGGNRLPVFGLKPAPVQVSWLGYPNTTGMPAIDAVVVGLPPEATVEMPVPPPRVIYRPRDEAPAVADPPCLVRGAATFGCFNNGAKLTDAAIDVWMRILDAVPASRLILKALAFAEPWAVSAMRQRWESRGLDPHRLELRGPSRYRDFMAQTADIDIALDPFPYGGSTTTLDMLYMGVPVVTLKSPDARAVANGLVREMGLAELSAADTDAYVACAVRLAGDPRLLLSWRRDMRGRFAASSYGDPRHQAQALARHMEAIYRALWQRWTHRKSGTLPAGSGPAAPGLIDGREIAGWLAVRAARLQAVGQTGEAAAAWRQAQEQCPDIPAPISFR